MQSLPPECSTRPPVAGAATSGAATRHDGFRDSDRSDGLGHKVADQGGRNTARLLRPPPELPVRRPPSYRRLTLPLLALASMIPGTAAAQSARPARRLLLARRALDSRDQRPVRGVQRALELLHLSAHNFLHWGVDDASHVFAAYAFTLESGFPEEAIKEVLRSREMVQFIE